MKVLTILILFGTLLLVSPSESDALSYSFEATLSGLSSTATGTASAIFDDTAHALHLTVSVDGLLSPTTEANIHCCAGTQEALPLTPNWPVGLTSFTFTRCFCDLGAVNVYSFGFVGTHGGTAESAQAALLAGFLGGQAYLNIQTLDFGQGEISGFFTQVSTPEPSSLLLIVCALVLVTAWRSRPSLFIRRS